MTIHGHINAIYAATSITHGHWYPLIVSMVSLSFVYIYAWLNIYAVQIPLIWLNALITVAYVAFLANGASWSWSSSGPFLLVFNHSLIRFNSC